MFPNPIRLLFALPQQPPRYLLAAFLNKTFSDAISEGELDFMEDVILRVVIADYPFQFDLTLENEKLRVTNIGNRWDLRITGSLYDFMLLASRREDADTLFFQRRLKTEGDTELGLCIKNFLDSQDMSELPFSGLVMTGLNKSIDLHQRFAPGSFPKF